MSLSKKSTFLFETIKIKDKVACELAYHEARMIASIGAKPLFNLDKILACELGGLVRARVVYNEFGELISVEYFPYKVREFKNFYLENIDFSYAKKYLDRSNIDKTKGNKDEIIMIKNGQILDTSIANIAIFDNPGWLTPRLPLLKGTCRQRLLDEGFLREADIDLNMLLKAKRFAVMNAMVGFYEIKKFQIITSSL